MRNRYLVCYDVADPKRLRRTHSKMLGYGDPVQFSVFECELSRQEIAIMRSDLADILNMSEDRVLIADLGPTDKGRRAEYIGVALPRAGREIAIVI